MSERDVRLYVTDMLEAIARIGRYIGDLTYEQFQANDMVVDAVVRNLEIIGEAARHVPASLRAQYTDINWTRVVGFRNIVIHAYHAVDVAIVWTIATQRVYELKPVLTRMLADLGPAS
jgi:uncharacterized protein with HEPN domain